MVDIRSGNIPYIRLAEQGSDPTVPANGFDFLYVKSDGLFIRTSAGTIVGPFGAGNSNVEQLNDLTDVDTDTTAPAVGSILVHNNTNFVVLNSGTQGQMLEIDTGEASGVKWVDGDQTARKYALLF